MKRKPGSHKKIFKQITTLFFQDKGFKISASLSYYTLFAMGPALLVIVSLLGIFFGRDAIRGRIFAEISSITGATAAKQIQEIIQNIELTGSNIPGLVTGGLILFLGSTGVFTEMQDSINYIWSVKAKPKKGWLKFLINRALSFSLLLGFGFILLVSLILNSGLEAVSQRLFALFPHTLVIVAYIANLVVMFIITTALFCMIYKVLPDAIIGWRDAYKGAMLTAVLFMAGKFLIAFYISRSRISTTYGAATSIIILLVWVYYSAIILYIGAAFTRARAVLKGEGITLKKDAVYVVRRESLKFEDVDDYPEDMNKMPKVTAPTVYGV